MWFWSYILRLCYHYWLSCKFLEPLPLKMNSAVRDCRVKGGQTSHDFIFVKKRLSALRMTSQCWCGPYEFASRRYWQEDEQAAVTSGGSFLKLLHWFWIHKVTPWPQSASELYRQSGRRRSAKLVPTFADRGVSRGQCNGSPRSLISVFWTGVATFYSSSSSIELTRLSGPRSRPTTTQKIW